MACFARFSSPVGLLTVACDNEALTGLWIEGQKYFAAGLPVQAVEAPDMPVLLQAGKWLDVYFRGNAPLPPLPPLAPRGTDFQKAVWHLLLQIPYGETTTYGALAAAMAERMGKPSMSAQAVGQAVGRNPISILIPCHRVLGMNGSLTGYAGGIEKKRYLLALESKGRSNQHGLE